jgi:hypothetical protein
MFILPVESSDLQFIITVKRIAKYRYRAAAIFFNILQKYDSRGSINAWNLSTGTLH